MNDTVKFLQSTVTLMAETKVNINGYRCLQEFVLKHGIECTAAPLPEGVKRGRVKLCYMNATKLALKRPDLVYVEGFAVGVIPVMHAWCVTPDGTVIDPTWDTGRDYFGVPIKTGYLRRAIVKSGFYGLIDNYQNEWPLLREPPELWKETNVSIRSFNL